MKRLLFLIFVLGLLLRIFISFQGYSGDINNHISWAKDILQNGTQGIYEREFYFRYGTLTPNYPPLILLLFTFSYWVYDSLYKLAWTLNTSVSLFPSNFIYFFQGLTTIPAFLKIPAILGDIGIAYYMYLFSKRITTNKNWHIAAPALILFNPAFFYNSSLWGQVESIPVFFVLASFYHLLYSKIAIVPGLLFTLAILSKQNAVIFALPFLMVFWKKYGIQKSITAALSSLLLFWIAFTPFNNGNFLTFPFEVYWNKILTNSVSDYVTYHAFNLWTLFVGQERIHDSVPFISGINYQIWGYLLFGTILFFSLWKLWKNKVDSNTLIYSTTLISFASFLFLTRLHERHFEPTLPFLLLVAIKGKRFIPVFLFASIFHLANLYHDWWLPRIDNLVLLLSNPGVLNAGVIIMLLLFLYLLSGFLSTRKNV